MATFVLTFDDIVLSNAERPMPAFRGTFIWPQVGVQPTNDNGSQETSSGLNVTHIAESRGWAEGSYAEAALLPVSSLNGNFDLRGVSLSAANLANFILTVKAYGNGLLVGTKMLTFANDSVLGPRNWWGADNGFVDSGEATEFTSDRFVFDGIAPQHGTAEAWIETGGARMVFRARDENDLPADAATAGNDEDAPGETVKYVLATLPAFGILLLDGRLMGPNDSLTQAEVSRSDLVSSVDRIHTTSFGSSFTISDRASGDALAFKRAALDSQIGFGARSLSVGTSTENKAEGIDAGGRMSVGANGVMLVLGHNEIVADQGNNLISGGPGNDAFRARGGDDLVFGSDGDDEIDAGDGENFVDGGAGDDKIATGSGDDQVLGGDGDDDIDAGDGNNRVSGGAGNDRIRTGSGNDKISGGVGDDMIDAGGGDDKILLGVDAAGGDGNDTIFGGAGADEFVITGHFGLDAIKDFGVEDRLVSLDPVGAVQEARQPADQGTIEKVAGLGTLEERGFLAKDADWAALNGGFIITERSNNDLLLTFNFGGGEASMLTLSDFFSHNSGPGFGAETTPDGILDDAAAVPILSAIFKDGSNSAQDYDFLI